MKYFGEGTTIVYYVTSNNYLSQPIQSITNSWHFFCLQILLNMSVSISIAIITVKPLSFPTWIDSIVSSLLYLLLLYAHSASASHYTVSRVSYLSYHFILKSRQWLHIALKIKSKPLNTPYKDLYDPATRHITGPILRSFFPLSLLQLCWSLIISMLLNSFLRQCSLSMCFSSCF